MSEQTLSIMDLRDIVIPDPVGLWPPAPFVWVLLGAGCLGLAVLIWRGVVRWRARAYRREGLARLSQIEGRLLARGEAAAALADLSVLLKRVALAAFPRRQVAPLYGENWLAFLDSSCQEVSFKNGPGRLLASAMMAAPDAMQISTDDCIQLVKLTRAWINDHHVPNIDSAG
jgi:hypothetical protein